MASGIRIKDNTEGDVLVLTPDLFTVVSAGRAAMPASGTSTETYGVNIDLPGTVLYKEADIGVIATAFELNIDALLLVAEAGTPNYDAYAIEWAMHDDTFDFFTRNDTTGVMTTWNPAADEGDDEAYDSILSIYPVALWDKRNATTFTSINIFAGMCYEVYDKSASAYIKAYALGSQGVEHVDYAVHVRNYSEL